MKASDEEVEVCKELEKVGATDISTFNRQGQWWAEATINGMEVRGCGSTTLEALHALRTSVNIGKGATSE